MFRRARSGQGRGRSREGRKQRVSGSRGIIRSKDRRTPIGRGGGSSATYTQPTGDSFKVTRYPTLQTHLSIFGSDPTFFLLLAAFFLSLSFLFFFLSFFFSSLRVGGFRPGRLIYRADSRPLSSNSACNFVNEPPSSRVFREDR